MSIDKLMSDDNFNIDKSRYVYVEIYMYREKVYKYRSMCQFYINVNK